MKSPDLAPPSDSAKAFTLAAALRMAFVAVMVGSQLLLCFVIIRIVRSHAVAVYALLEFASAALAIVLMSGQKSSAYRYAWVVVVLLLGVFGLLLYWLWGRGSGGNALGRRLQAANATCDLLDAVDPAALEEAQQALRQEAPACATISQYLTRHGFPLYQHTDLRYFPLGEQAFDAMLADMETATIGIDLEFFIVFEGKLWERFFDVMSRKAAQGLRVRMMYDDMGSMPTTTAAFLSRVKDAGIALQIFNRVEHYTRQLYLNYRDHRKIVVIDGRIAYTGGINIGDEYANLYPKLGHWKDTAVRLEGPGARSLATFFTRMWAATTNAPVPYDWPEPLPYAGAQGFVQPYDDGPYSNPENPAEALYIKMLYAAQDTVYITSPYLIIDDLLLEALCQAARSGVDVRLVLPGTPDHWYVQWIAQCFYGDLLRAGVRLYEYTPGFIHAKMMVTDKRHAIVGSINLDYRSFNLQYEVAVWCCGGTVPDQVHTDIQQVIAASAPITLETWQQRKWYRKLLQPILKLFAPLM